MQYIKINREESRPAVIAAIAGSLLKGEIAVLPTDTIYGFSCAAASRQAIRRIYRLKGRDEKKPLIILVSSLAMARRYAHIKPGIEAKLASIWSASSRPTTVILSDKENLPPEISAGSGGLAVRLPKSDFLIRIIRKINQPLVSTSLNISGQEEINEVDNLAAHWPRRNNQPDMVIDAGRPRRRRASRVIDWRNDKPVVIRR